MAHLRKRRPLGNRRGFTLIELMIVVAVIAILTTIAVPLYQNIQSRARTAKAQADVRSIASAIVQYSAYCGGYPGRAGDTCTPGGAALTAGQGLLAMQVSSEGQTAGPWFAGVPSRPPGWGRYRVTYPAPGTFQVRVNPRDTGDNGGNRVTAP